MKKSSIVSIIIGIALLVVGGIIFLISLASMKFSFKGLNTDKRVENTHKITESFKKIDIETSTADITFVKSNNGSCTVECTEFEDQQHEVSVSGNTLKIVEKDTTKIHFFNVDFGETTMVITLPEKEYDELKIDTSTGDVKIPSDFTFEDLTIKASTADITSEAKLTDNVKITTSTGDIILSNLDCDDADLETSTGSITLEDSEISSKLKLKSSTGRNKLKDLKCDSLESNASTGKIELTSVLVSKKLYIKRSTGDVSFDGCDASEIFVQTDTGDVKGTLLTDKVFITKSDTGDIDVPSSITGGKCEIKTDTGDIKISVK